jgi:hypothetical protein
MNANERLTEVFDRGCRDGTAILTPNECDLYTIQEFILDFEMNGLSGYLYNRLPDIGRIRATADAMRRQNLTALARILGDALHLFESYVDPDPPTTWNAMIRRYDPENRSNALSDEICSLDDYGLADSGIAE